MWEHHFGEIACAWALAFVRTCRPGIWSDGGSGAEVWRTLTLEFFPFIVLLFALFVVAGGIRITGNLVGTPATNTALLAFGTLVGEPVRHHRRFPAADQAPDPGQQDRQHKSHVFIFFIFLVGNIGGSLTPLGNPPLFLGFLKGVSFLWTLQTMWRPMLLASGILLALFYVIDRLAWYKEYSEVKGKKARPRQIRIEGAHNIIYLAVVVDTVLSSGLWDARCHGPCRLRHRDAAQRLAARLRVAVYQLSVMEDDTSPRSAWRMRLPGRRSRR